MKSSEEIGEYRYGVIPYLCSEEEAKSAFPWANYFVGSSTGIRCFETWEGYMDYKINGRISFE